MRYTSSFLVTLTIIASLPEIANAQIVSGLDPSNPFYKVSSLPFSTPAFDKIKNSDFKPAIEEGMRQQLDEIEEIANNPAAPTF